MVYFDRMVVIDESEETPIFRTEDNKRERPDADQRHATNTQSQSNSNLDLVDLRDFEWLAWNYRTQKSETKFESRKDMVAQMFNRTFSFLPSVEEILYGIIHAQMD